MGTTPPTPETTASMFVWALASLTAFTVVLVLLVVRRRGNLPVTLALSGMLLLVLAATGLNLIVPAQVRSPTDPAVRTTCPYDRLAWSNMKPDVDAVWQPCRRAARVQLAATLGGGALVTVMVTVALLRSRPGEPAVASHVRSELFAGR